MKETTYSIRILAVLLVAAVVIAVIAACVYNAQLDDATKFFQEKTSLEGTADPAVVAEVKEVLRDATAPYIPEGYTFVDDMVKSAVRTPDMYFLKYSVLIRDTSDDLRVIVFGITENETARLFVNHIAGRDDGYIPQSEYLVIQASDKKNTGYDFDIVPDGRRWDWWNVIE